MREVREANRDWRYLAREDQLPPDGDWNTWTLIIGFSVSLGAALGKLLPALTLPRP